MAANADVDRATVRAEICAERIVALSEQSSLTPAEFDALAEAHAELAERTAFLRRAGEVS
jgi:hypothetical protein